MSTQLSQLRAEEGHAIAGAGEEHGKDGDEGVENPRDWDEPQTKGHHHHPTRGRWSLLPLRSP